MAKKKKPITRYRDRKTGKFVSKVKWKRSRAARGSNVKREFSHAKRKAKNARVTRRPRTLPRPRKKTRREIVEEDEEIEFSGAFDSP
jgi:hypothetical protein